jgi:uncharacterized protein YdiU (UPF0061 family)
VHFVVLNFRLVLRNHLAQQAIERAEEDDYSEVRHLLEELKNPYGGTDCAMLQSSKPDEARQRFTLKRSALV